MGVRTGVKKVARGIAIGALAVAMAACSTSGSGVVGNVTLQKALDDYFAGNTTLAAKEFAQVVKQDPGNKYGWYNLATIAQFAGNNGEAAKNYEKALAIDPNFESALYNYGVLDYTQNKLDDAITYLGKAVAVNAKDGNAHWNLGLALARKHTPADNARSKTELNAALKIDPSLIKSLGVTPRGGTGGAGGSVTAPKGVAPTTSKASAP